MSPFNSGSYGVSAGAVGSLAYVTYGLISVSVLLILKLHYDEGRLFSSHGHDYTLLRNP